MNRLNNSPREDVSLPTKDRLDLLTGYPMLETLVPVAVIPIEILRLGVEIPQPKTCQRIGSELHFRTI